MVRQIGGGDGERTLPYIHRSITRSSTLSRFDGGRTIYLERGRVGPRGFAMLAFRLRFARCTPLFSVERPLDADLLNKKGLESAT